MIKTFIFETFCLISENRQHFVGKRTRELWAKVSLYYINCFAKSCESCWAVSLDILEINTYFHVITAAILYLPKVMSFYNERVVCCCSFNRCRKTLLSRKLSLLIWHVFAHVASIMIVLHRLSELWWLC